MDINKIIRTTEGITGFKDIDIKDEYGYASYILSEIEYSSEDNVKLSPTDDRLVNYFLMVIETKDWHDDHKKVESIDDLSYLIEVGFINGESCTNDIDDREPDDCIIRDLTESEKEEILKMYNEYISTRK